MRSIINYSTSPEKLLQEDNYQKLFPEHKESKKRGIDYEALSKFLSELWDGADPIIKAVKIVIGEDAVKLTAKQAYEALLFSVLFAYVHREPRMCPDVAQLQKDLQLDEPQVLLKRKAIPLINIATELPSFQKFTKGTSLHLDLVTIHNETDKTALITLKDSPLQRHLKPGEKLLALQVDGQVATFLPRLCVSCGQALYRDGNYLTTSDTKDGEEREPDEIAFCSESEHFGLLEADWEGNWIPTRDLELKPSKSIRWLKGASEDYGFMYADGSYEGVRERKAWKEQKLLAFDLGGGGYGVALTADRKAIDKNGHTLGENVAAVSCCWDKYILLMMDGSVVTDRCSRRLDSPARAVCADISSYWIATDDGLIHMDEKGHILSSNLDKLDEVERNNSGEVVFGRQVDGLIRRIF